MSEECDNTKAKDIEAFCRCFIRRIGSPNRKSKRVDLLRGDGKLNLLTSHWIKGALGTTALRKRPALASHEFKKVVNLKAKAASEPLQKKVIGLNSALRESLNELSLANNDSFTRLLFEFIEKLTQMAQAEGVLWSFGRSQKYFNILLKYCFAVSRAFPEKLDASDNALIGRLEPFLHVPVDAVVLNFMQKRLKNTKLEKLYWGWNMNETSYLWVQDELRKLAKEADCSPIAYETTEIW